MDTWDFDFDFLVVNVIILRTFIFELYLENTKLLGNMDMVTAIAAFFHLCFVFDLKYPKVRTLLVNLS